MGILKTLVELILCGGIFMTSTASDRLFSEQKASAPKKEKLYVALTFDDGPNTVTTPLVLDKLEKYGIKASFFVIGDNINSETENVVKRAFDMGCEINNHSKTHSDMTKMTEKQIKSEINFTSEKVKKITGKAPVFFRPPYIAVNKTMFDSIDLPFICGCGANDWEDSVSADMRAEKILSNVRDGSIILLHDMTGNSKTVEALDTIIPEMQKRGYEFVTVSELFNKENVEIRPDTDIIYSNAKQTTMYGTN